MTGLLLQINWQNIETRLGGEKLINIIWCVGIIVATLLLKKTLAKIISRLSASIANRFTDKKHSALFCELTQGPLESLLQTILFFIAVNQLGVLLGHFVLPRYENKHEKLAIRLGDVADHIFLFFTILFSTILLARIIDFIYRTLQDKASEEGNKERQQLLPLVKDVAKLLLWIIGIFWTLGAVFHVNIPALITGIGIGGVAIALAAKESIENLFAAFTILNDKPFQVGDTIRLASLEGVVERIGLRSTRLRNADGAAFIIPNQKLVNENMENLSKRDTRRVRTVINIKYGVDHTDLEQAVTALKKAIQDSFTIAEPIEVSLESFGENVFQIVVIYYLPEPLPDNMKLNAIKHEINMLTYKTISKFAGAANISVQESSPANPIEPEEETKEDNII